MKKTNKLGNAANANTEEYRFPSLIICQVSSNPYLEKYCKYKNTPAAVAKREITNPMAISFLIDPMYSTFGSYDEQSDRTEPER